MVGIMGRNNKICCRVLKKKIFLIIYSFIGFSLEFYDMISSNSTGNFSILFFFFEYFTAESHKEHLRILAAICFLGFFLKKNIFNYFLKEF